MKHLIFLFLLLTSSVYAIHYNVDRKSSSYELRKQTKRVDTFDFEGEYPLLENIDIDAKRNKRVEFLLTGEYPLLEKVNYEGTFGSLTGKLTGHFPQLQLINFLCTSCAMDLDLQTKWKRSCEINIRGMKEDIILTLPKDIGIEVNTKIGARGKVVVGADLKKQGWLGLLKKTYHNQQFKDASVVLIINVETTDGRIILN